MRIHPNILSCPDSSLFWEFSEIVATLTFPAPNFWMLHNQWKWWNEKNICPPPNNRIPSPHRLLPTVLITKSALTLNPKESVGDGNQLFGGGQMFLSFHHFHWLCSIHKFGTGQHVFFAGFGGGNHHHSMVVVVYNIDLLTTTHEYQNAQKRPAPEGRSWNTLCPTPSNDLTNIDGGTSGGTRFHHYGRWLVEPNSTTTGGGGGIRSHDYVRWWWWWNRVTRTTVRSGCATTVYIGNDRTQKLKLFVNHI